MVVEIVRSEYILHRLDWCRGPVTKPVERWDDFHGRKVEITPSKDRRSVPGKYEEGIP